MDATVTPAPLRLSLKPQVAVDVMPLIAELEQAIRADQMARRSGDKHWMGRTARKVNGLKQRINELQEGG